MKIVKIVQDPESGKVGVQVKHDEQYDIEEHIQLLTEFAGEQALKNHELRKSHEGLVTRLGECEKKLSELSQKIQVN